MCNHTRCVSVPTNVNIFAAMITSDILGILNNVCIISAIWFSRGIKEITGKFLFNQAVADMCIAFTYLVSTVSFIILHGHIYHTMLVLTKCFIFVFYCMTMQMLASITVILTIAITRPHMYTNHVSQKRARILIIMIWILTSMLSAHNIWYQLYHKDPTLPHMFLADQDRSYWWILTLNFMVLFVIPFIVASASFIMIFCYTRKVHQNQIGRGTARHVRQAMSILIFSIIYTITFLPMFVIELAMPKKEWQYWIMTGIFSSLNYIYMVIKFPLYLALFKQYRDYVKKILRCRTSTVHAVNDQMVFTPDPSGLSVEQEKTGVQQERGGGGSSFLDPEL